MVERKTLNLVVVGSIPTGGAFWIVLRPGVLVLSTAAWLKDTQ